MIVSVPVAFCKFSVVLVLERLFVRILVSGILLAKFSVASMVVGSCFNSRTRQVYVCLRIGNIREMPPDVLFASDLGVNSM